MIQKKLQAWRPFFHLLSVSGIPWIWYLADVLFGLVISMLTVCLPQITGAIMQGEIFDKGLIADYAGITLFSMLLSFLSTLFGSWIGFHTDQVLRKPCGIIFVLSHVRVPGLQALLPDQPHHTGYLRDQLRHFQLHWCGCAVADSGIPCNWPICFSVLRRRTAKTGSCKGAGPGSPVTCVIVTHDMNLARTAGHIIVLDRGTVCGEGTHDTLYESCSVYRNLYDKAIS